MKTVPIIPVATSLALATQVHATEVPKPTATAKPNILFLLTDDWRWNNLGCMGDTNILTPNIDRLAREGMLKNLPSCGRISKNIGGGD